MRPWPTRDFTTITHGRPDLSDCCGDAKFRQCIKNKNKGRGGRSSSNGSTCSQGAASNRGRRLPEPPTRQALLAALKSIPAGVRVLIALLEDHRAILTKPESQVNCARGNTSCCFGWQLGWDVHAV